MPDQLRIRIVDAFADRPFTGNQAGVVLLPDRYPETAWLQRVAAEVNVAETAFAHPLPDDPDADWALRWFTPRVEVDLCGHATLATAHVLFETGGAARADAVRFRTRSGVLTVRDAGDDGLAMDFPAPTVTATTEPAGVDRALGVRPVAVYDTGTLGDLLVELADEAAVRELRPVAAELERLPYRGVIATAPGDAGAGRHFVSRFFAPRVGVPEDPVTGSAHTALAVFWSARLGANELVGYQASERGGVVGTALRGDRVLLAGHAVTVIDGDLLPRPPG